MTTMTQHFVTFYSPGTFVAEETIKPIGEWDTTVALRMAAEVTERHNAKPYAFAFTTRSRGDADLDSKVTARSALHYFGVKVETLADIEARNDPADRTLIANMRGNEYPRVVTTTSGWKATMPLRDGDVVLP